MAEPFLDRERVRPLRDRESGEGLSSLPFDLAVTGGTGEFSNVRGTVYIETLDAAERETLTLIP